MSMYGYTVKQEDAVVILEVYRKGELIQTRTISWCDLNVAVAVMLCPEGSSKALSRQFKIAHKEGKKIVKILEDNEKLELGAIYVD